MQYFHLTSLLFVGMCWAGHVSVSYVMSSATYWTVYIFLKHASEIIALALSLVVSSSIKSYEHREVFARRDPLELLQQGKGDVESDSNHSSMQSVSERSSLLESSRNPRTYTEII